MKTRLIWLAIASIALVVYAADVPIKPKADITVQLQEISARTAALEQRIQALEHANVRLQQQVNDLTKPRLTPLSK